jgi:hypothetical protein
MHFIALIFATVATMAIAAPQGLTQKKKPYAYRCSLAGNDGVNFWPARCAVYVPFEGVSGSADLL